MSGASMTTVEFAKRNHRTLWGDVWVQFRKHKLALFGSVTLTILVLGSFVGPLIYHGDPD